MHILMNQEPFYGNFHDDTTMNFQLNRVLTNSGCPREELYEIGGRIHSYSDATPVALEYYRKALEENRTLHALFYLRFAEFFLFNDNEEKDRLYNEFRDLFYKVYSDHNIKRTEVPYGHGALSVLECYPDEEPMDTLVVHGGGDSFIEEFYPNVLPLVEKGYRIILFEGPGQGQPLHKYDLKMTHQWEKPVGAILDHYGLKDVTLIGISLGGHFALRTAAFEKRISRVVLWDVVYDFFECVYRRNGRLRYFMINTLVTLGARKPIERIVEKQIARVPDMKWLMEHSFYVHGVDTAFDFLIRLKRYSTASVSSLVTQDVFVMAGRDDYIIPFDMYARQIKALKNARSVTGRVFTKEESASSHCQVGNIPLAIEEITNWLNLIQ